MKAKDKIMYLLFFIVIGMCIYLYVQIDITSDKQEINAIKNKVNLLVQSDSLLTLQLQTKIIASDSIINQLKIRLESNEKEIKRLRKDITIYDYTSSQLPDL